MDNFKGHASHSPIYECFGHSQHPYLFATPNTTDRLQPMDVSANKLEKHFLKSQFDQWYSKHAGIKQLEQEDTSDIKALELQPIDLGLIALKEVGAKWQVDMATYVSDNPQMIVNGFIHSEVVGALDGQEIDNLVKPEDDQELDSGEDFDTSGEDFSESEAKLSDSQ